MSDDEVWRREEVESPCVKICMIHPESRLCVGCRRTIEEIGTWSRLSAEQRRAIMAELPDRNPGRTSRSGGRSARLKRP